MSCAYCSSGVPNCVAYLTSAQALADYATLIVHLKSELHAVNAPVVAFGGSYGGMMLNVCVRQVWLFARGNSLYHDISANKAANLVGTQ